MNCGLYWYRNEPNFGDAFSPMAVRHCFGFDPRPAGKWSADLVAEGSVLDFALLRDVPDGFWAAKAIVVRAALNRMFRPPLVVWGSGMLFPLEGPRVEIPIRRTRFLAVRGEFTRSQMSVIGLLDPRHEIVMGDPGLFMPEVLGIDSNPEYERGLVLHASLWDDGTAESFAFENPRIRLIDPRRHPREVVADIARCRSVFSNSLHGLVAADALGIPNRWVALETRFADARRNRFKFDDYYSAFGERRDPCSLREVAAGCPFDPVSSVKIEAVKDALRNVAVINYAS